jgi:voltage-gated potassium channel
MRALRNVKFLSAALLCVVLTGTVGFHYIEHWSWFDGFYMVLTTLTTIGYGETHALSPTGRYFNVFIILAGVALVFLILGALGQALLEFEFHNVFGRRRMEREIGRLNAHYIICGAGRVGRAVARQLESKPAQFVILESDEAKADRIRAEYNWLVVHADATLEAQLLAARIDHAAGLVAATTTDATNTYVVLTARSLNPTLKIIARASEEGAEKHMRTAGADQVVSPYSFAGFRIAEAFLRPHVINFIEVALQRSSELGLELEELTIDPSSIYVGQSLRSSGIRQDLGINVLAIKREGEEMKYSPGPDALLGSGNHLIVMGEPSRLRKLEVLAGAKK